jgi:LPS sulfotransferase NodH
MSTKGVTYAVCATPRSGSNLLCDLLASSKDMGSAKEIFNIRSMVLPFVRENPICRNGSADSIDLGAYLDQVRAVMAGWNGAFGVKLMIEQARPFFSAPPVEALLREARYIWLVRRDIVAQAVSWHIALQTGRWDTLPEDPTDLRGRPPRRPLSEVEYDRDAIGELARKIALQNGLWLRFFSVNRYDFKQVAYEDLLEDPHGICAEICDYCGVETDHRFSLEDASLHRQTTEVNARFIERFRRTAPSRLRANRRLRELEVEGVTFTLSKPKPARRARSHAT